MVEEMDRGTQAGLVRKMRRLCDRLGDSVGVCGQESLKSMNKAEH